MNTLIVRALADLDTVVDRDPSMRSRLRALKHPCVWAIWGHRVSHALHRRGLRALPRLVSTIARQVSRGIQIYPEARVGQRLFIARGHVVIGAATVLGDDVSVDHDVCLGANHWWQAARSRRGPTVGDRVVIGAGAIIVGPVRVGTDAVISPGAIVIADVAPRSHVVRSSEHRAHALPPLRGRDAFVSYPSW